MAAQQTSTVIDIKAVSGTFVALTLGSDGTAKMAKSTDGINWTTITTDTSGTFFEIGLSSASKSYAVYLPWNGSAYTADYLKEVSSLSSVANNTASGSRIWYSADLDNWSGANKYILAGTSSGLYRSNDAGVSWSSL